MPTIQLKLTDEQFQHLQKLSGQATGVKALQTIVSEYEQISQMYTDLLNRHADLIYEHDQYREKLQLCKGFLTWVHELTWVHDLDL